MKQTFFKQAFIIFKLKLKFKIKIYSIMKKLVLALAAIFAMSFVSCNTMCNKDAESTDSTATDTTEVVDSLAGAAADSVVTVESTAVAE